MHTFSPKVSLPFRPASAYEVLSNVTRRRILDYLRLNGSTDLLKLADEFALSNLKIYHHIELLEDNNLVKVTQKGNNRYASFRPIGWARLKKNWEESMQGSFSLRLAR